MPLAIERDARHGAVIVRSGKMLTGFTEHRIVRTWPTTPLRLLDDLCGHSVNNQPLHICIYQPHNLLGVIWLPGSQSRYGMYGGLRQG